MCSLQLRHEHFDENATGQSISNPLHPQHHSQQQRWATRDSQEKEQEQQQLQKILRTRPTPQDLYNRNILVDKKQKETHRRRASQNLTNSLSQRPTHSDLVARGILQNDNQQFEQKLARLLDIVDGSLSNADGDRLKIHDIARELKQDYHSGISRLHGQLSEYKQTLHQFQDDVHSREQRWRLEIENKQRVLLHMNGLCAQQKADAQALRSEFEEKIREMEAKYGERADQNKGSDRMAVPNHIHDITETLQILKQQNDAVHHELQKRGLQNVEQHRKEIHSHLDRVKLLSTAMYTSSSVSANQERGGVAVQQLESKIQKQGDQIKKLKQQKKEMVALVNDKMATLKFIHQQELQKERHIANVLVSNHEKQIEALKARVRGNDYRVNDHQSAEMEHMRRQLEDMQRRYRESQVENQALKKSKKSLERMVQSFTQGIVQTASHK